MKTDRLRAWRDVLLGCLPFVVVIAANCYFSHPAKQAKMHHGIKAIPPHVAR